MKNIVLIVFFIGLLGIWPCIVWPNNPFTSRQEAQGQTSEPIFKSPFFIKIIFWQYKLKQQMAELVQVARNERSVKPLVVLMGLSFLYGVAHAAGPGHGKAVAISYVLSHRSTVFGGMIFGLGFALIHALSGVVGVLGLHYLIQRSISETLSSVTMITQIISFSLIVLLGSGILIKYGYIFLKPLAPKMEVQLEKSSRKGVITWAASVGLVPCPAVVMAMLFCLSMDAPSLGLLLATCISIGMATTIFFVVVAITVGKSKILSIVSKNYTMRVEGIIGLLSGAAITIFGVAFLLSTINMLLL